MATEVKLSYETFKRAFLAHELEAYFECGEYQIRLIDAPRISEEASCACVLKPNKNHGLLRSLWERLTNRDFVSAEDFVDRETLLKEFRFKGKTIQELWPELVPLFDL